MTLWQLLYNLFDEMAQNGKIEEDDHNELSDEDIRRITDREFSNSELAVVPALYAWSQNGWIAAICAYIATLLLLAGLSWASIFGAIRGKRVTVLRWTIVIGAMIAIAIANVEYGMAD